MLSIFFDEGWVNGKQTNKQKSAICFKTCKEHEHTHADDYTETHMDFLEPGRMYIY